jgi:hypothetical protein
MEELIREVKTNHSGKLLKKEIAYYGGEYSFFEKIKNGGIGSSKIIYESGINEFDKLHRGVENEVSYVNFELLKNGLIFRLNRNQRVKCLGIRLNDIESISLIAYSIELKEKYRKRIVHRGELDIIDKERNLKGFRVLTREFKEIVNFFQRKELADKFNYSVSLKAPERDYGYLINLLDGLF